MWVTIFPNIRRKYYTQAPLHSKLLTLTCLLCYGSKLLIKVGFFASNFKRLNYFFGYLLQYSCLENHMDRGGWVGQSMGSQRVGNDWSNLAYMQGTRIICNWKTRRQHLSKVELENDYCAQYYLKTPISYAEFILLVLKIPGPLSSITF